MTKSQLKAIAKAMRVTDHSDLRAFLALVFAEAKSQDSAYSYAQFSADLGLGSANAHSIIRGRRPLTEKSAAKIAQVLGLAGSERSYLLALVRGERAKTIEAASQAFEDRLQIKQKSLPNELDRRQLSFFEHWYHAAILETLRLRDALDDPEWLAAHIRPSISVSKVRESLELLTFLGYLIRCEESGRLVPSDQIISTGNEVAGMAIASFHRQMLKLAFEAIERMPSGEREISAVTITVSPKVRQQMKDEIAGLRKRFLHLAAADENATEVVQVNFQLFPISGTGEK